ncbi:photosystem I assembly protein Ycf3 [Rosistilla carotiformis]|uniref:Photosystem I assembly protein Ycf3 n=1 Tax=Rosistilla carotiformis TaxID=2528017 RepID=A0A518JXQ8_9BACT|nr:tetratricopeptide repeat protein [Rosistilla carotiformis]QDV70325.1 photosystem I assembly protein Ycf3 [Rosistilla carotiformis]
MLRQHLFIGSCILIWAGVAAAQNPSTAALLKTAYTISKNASTEADYTRIIDQIQQSALAAADQEVRAYGNQLLAWALNRRGELRWDQIQVPDDAMAVAAIEDFRNSLKLDPNRWRAKQNMAFVYATRGQMKEAEALFNDVIQTKPDHANAYFNRAELRYEMGNLSSSIADYDRAITLQPGEADFYTGRGHARFQAGQVQAAIEDYHRAFQLDSDNAIRAIDLADALQNGGQWRQAAENYRNALQLDQQNLRTRLNLAWLLATCPDGSLRDGQQALEITDGLRDIPASEEFRYIDTHAAALAETGQFEKAVRIAQTGERLVPTSERSGFEARLEGYKTNQRYRQVPVR